MIDKEVEPGLTRDEKMYSWWIFSTEVGELSYSTLSQAPKKERWQITNM